VVLVWLDQIEVGTFTLREAILSVQLEFGSDNWIFTPAVHVKGSLGKDEDTGVRDSVCTSAIETGLVSGRYGAGSSSGHTVVEKAIIINNVTSGGARLGTGTESKDGVGEGIDGIGVVEWLSAEGFVKNTGTDERVAVGDVKVRLDNPDKFFAWVIEVKFDLVGR